MSLLLPYSITRPHPSLTATRACLSSWTEVCKYADFSMTDCWIKFLKKSLIRLMHNQKWQEIPACAFSPYKLNPGKIYFCSYGMFYIRHLLKKKKKVKESKSLETGKGTTILYWRLKVFTQLGRDLGLLLIFVVEYSKTHFPLFRKIQWSYVLVFRLYMFLFSMV